MDILPKINQLHVGLLVSLALMQILRLIVVFYNAQMCKIFINFKIGHVWLHVQKGIMLIEISVHV